MQTLKVGYGNGYATIAEAVRAAEDGATIDVKAGTYTNDFVSTQKNLTFNAVGGMVTMAATVEAPNGKAILTAGAPGVTVNITGFAFTGCTVSDGNGAGIRYEGGTMNISNSYFSRNQNGILGAPDPNGVISITNSEFNRNGAGDGRTHNMYIGDIAKFSLSNSYVHDASVGHEIKSRAANNSITGNRILSYDSTSSYEIDLPNGGNSVISGNLIQQGRSSQNSNIIAFGEEGNVHAGSALTVSDNIIVNDIGYAPALTNSSGVTATFSNNQIYGFTGALVQGPATQSGTTVLSSRPSYDKAPSGSPPPSPPPITPPVTPTPSPVIPPSATSGLVLTLSQDAYQGDAQFTVTVDGAQFGQVYTATASHAAGQTQQVAIGALSAGPHQIGVNFLNDKYDGSSSTDRNLYLDGATYNGVAVANSSQVLLSAGTKGFSFTGDAPPATSGLVINVAEDAWRGDAQFTVSVDGRQVGGVRTATASNAAGQSQAISVDTVFAGGQHQVGITFLNDAYGGPGADRNLYVTGASYNGQNVPNSTGALYSNGTMSFGVNAGVPTSSTAVINVSGDSYQGDAQFTVAVDGQQYGGVYTATAAHGSGASQAITITGIAKGFGPRDIAVSFLNDRYDGTPGTDRNLYVNSIQFDGQNVPGGSATMLSAGTQHFTAAAPANWTG